MWYAAILRYEAQVSDERGEPSLWEDAIVVVEATTSEAARRIAHQVGNEREVSYSNPAGAGVTWVFHGVVEVQDLVETELKSGTEVFSWLYYPDKVGDFASSRGLKDR